MSIDARFIEIQNFFKTGASSYIDDALSLFSYLAVIEISLFGLIMLLGYGKSLFEIFIQIFKISLFFWFIKDFSKFQKIIINGFAYSAHKLSQQPGDFNENSFFLVSKYYQSGSSVLEIISECTEGMNFLFDFFILAIIFVLGLFVFLALVVIGLNAVLAILEYYLITAIALILLPFIALSPTRFIGEKTFAVFISHGVKTATIIVISSFVLSDITAILNSNSEFCMPDAEFGQQLELSGVLFVTVMFYLLLVLNVPALAAGVLTGSPKLGAGGALAVAGAAVGTAILSPILATKAAGAGFRGARNMAGAARSGFNKASDAFGRGGGAGHSGQAGGVGRQGGKSSAGSGASSSRAKTDKGAAESFVKRTSETVRRSSQNIRTLNNLDNDKEGK